MGFIKTSLMCLIVLYESNLAVIEEGGRRRSFVSGLCREPYNYIHTHTSVSRKNIRVDLSAH